LAKRVVTLEIDTTAIRVMETSGRRVIKWASLSLEPTMTEGGVISDPQALGTAVKQVMSSSGIEAKDVIASVSGLYSVNRMLTVANLPGGAATQEAVLAAAEATMPLAMDEIYLAWQTISTSEDGRHLLAVGMPRDVIDAEVRALRAVGINPYLLDLKTMALARAVNKEQALILNIELSSFDIVIVVNGIPEVMRTIAWQQEDLTLEDRVEQLAVSLELTVGFYNSNHLDAPLDPATPFFITGQMSGNLALVEKLQARVGYLIEPLAPSLECPAHLPVSQYAVNIGLALKGTVPSENVGQGGYLPPDINLLPQIYKPWKPSAKQLYFVCFIIAAIALLFPLYQLASGAMDKTAGLQATYDDLNSEMQKKQLEIQKRVPLQKAIDEYGAIVDMGGGFTEALTVINSQAGGLGIQVESVVHGGETITVTCEADSYLTFREYVTALEESGRFFTPVTPPEGYPYVTRGSIKLEPKPAE